MIKYIKSLSAAEQARLWGGVILGFVFVYAVILFFSVGCVMLGGSQDVCGL